MAVLFSPRSGRLAVCLLLAFAAAPAFATDNPMRLAGKSTTDTSPVWPLTADPVCRHW